MSGWVILKAQAPDCGAFWIGGDSRLVSFTNRFEPVSVVTEIGCAGGLAQGAEQLLARFRLDDEQQSPPLFG